MLFVSFSLQIRIQLLLSRTKVSNQDSCYNLRSKITTNKMNWQGKLQKVFVLSVFRIWLSLSQSNKTVFFFFFWEEIEINCQKFLRQRPTKTTTKNKTLEYVFFLDFLKVVRKKDDNSGLNFKKYICPHLILVFFSLSFVQLFVFLLFSRSAKTGS